MKTAIRLALIKLNSKLHSSPKFSQSSSPVCGDSLITTIQTHSPVSGSSKGKEGEHFHLFTYRRHSDIMVISIAICIKVHG